MNPAPLIRSLALPLALLATPALAAPAPGELPLHIEATGTAMPDIAVVTLRIDGSGKDEASAMADLAERQRMMFTALDGLGVAAGDRRNLDEAADAADRKVDVVAPAVYPGAEDAARDAARVAAAVAADAAHDATCSAIHQSKKQARECMEEPKSEVSEVWLVTLRKPEMLRRLRELDGGGFEITSPYRPAMQYSNPAAARDAAVAKALANARDEADRYARALGYRVVRIERVSNTKPAINLPDVMSAFATMDNRETREQAFQMGSMTAGIAVDFVMVPK